jgi:adenylate cyclase
MTLFESLPAACFQGVVPAQVATCSADGIPNVTMLSQVFRVDARHVALSCQFFNKTKENVAANPYAVIELYDPVTFDAYRLEIRYDRAETSGPLFDAMALRIEAIASHTGMKGVFRLRSADVYEVIACERRDGFLVPPPDDELEEPPDPTQPRSEIKCLQLVSQRTARAPTLDALFTALLEALDESLGFRHSMVLLPDETGGRLFAVASRGYGDAGVGAEISVGDGLIGTVARERRSLRLSNMDSELRYGRTVRASVQAAGGRRELSAEIPLPGLADAQSQLAIPLLACDRLMGVLAVESQKSLGFDDWDEAFLDIVGNQLAASIESAILRERSDEATLTQGAATAVAAPAAVALGVSPDSGPTRRFRFFPSDDCIFVGDDYLIRNLPGRILWKLLKAHVETGRTEFTNRELRLDASLGLPGLRDNLESRLVLLRRRLEQKCSDLKLVSTGRGQFRLEVGCRIELEQIPA